MGASPVNIRPARVDGFALRIGKRATLVPDSNAHVYGVVMDLTHHEVERLYSDASIRAYPYRPEAVEAEMREGARTPALCFNLAVVDSVDADTVYVAKLRDLALRLGLPSDYVGRIQ
jgi:hypothetical protein